MPKKTLRRELISWSIFLAVGLTLYLTGWHTEVIGQLQRVILATGIMRPDTDAETLGEASYAFDLYDAQGQRVDFDDFRGKTVFLNFWATWCPPCVAEMPDIHDLYQKKGDKVVFIMLSLDKEPDQARAFVERKGFTFPIYFPASPLPEVYDFGTIPTTYVISPRGEIVLARSGMAKYDTRSFREFLDKYSTQ